MDSDEVRPHLSPELGFSREDRDKNVRRMGYVAGLLARHGVYVIVAAVSPYHEARAAVRCSVPRFLEIFVDCPLDVCATRDVKGMYAQALAGKRPRFTGIDDPYEIPASPDVVVNTGTETIPRCLETIVETLRAHG